jgi:hypothetical protein
MMRKQDLVIGVRGTLKRRLFANIAMEAGWYYALNSPAMNVVQKLPVRMHGIYGT